MTKTTMSSAQKLFAILEALCMQGEMSALQLSQQLDITKASVHRILNTLRELDYVHAGSKTGLYEPSLKIISLGRQVERKSTLASLARPVMRQLRDTYNVVVNLGIFSGDHVHVVERLNPKGTPVSIVMDYIVPAYCSALGRVFLSRLSSSQIQEYMENIQPVAYTGRTKITLKDLETALDAVRERGYALDDRELNESLSCVAAPIVDQSDNLIAALSLAGLPRTTGPIFDAQLRDLREAVVSLTSRVSVL